MIALLKWLWLGHVHKWEQIGKTSSWEIVSDDDEVVSRGPRFVCRCTKCGAFKAFDL